MINNDEKEKKINWWHRFINFFLSLFRLHRIPHQKYTVIKEETSVGLEKAASQHNVTALSLSSTTVADSVQSSPEIGLLSASSPAFPCVQVLIEEPSANSDAEDIPFENGTEDINASLGVSEEAAKPAEHHAVELVDGADIDLLRHLLSDLYSLPERTQSIILEKICLAEDPTSQTEDNQAANEMEEPSSLENRLRMIPLAVYKLLNTKEPVNEEPTSYNSPRNR